MDCQHHMLTYSCFLPDVDADPGRTSELARVAAYPQPPTRRLRADENDIFNGAYWSTRFFSADRN